MNSRKYSSPNSGLVRFFGFILLDYLFSYSLSGVETKIYCCFPHNLRTNRKYMRSVFKLRFHSFQSNIFFVNYINKINIMRKIFSLLFVFIITGTSAYSQSGWQILNSGTTTYLSAVFFSNESTGYAGGVMLQGKSDNLLF